MRGTKLKGEVRISLINNPQLWANVLGIFSRAPAHRRPFDTKRLRRFAPKSAPRCKEVPGLLRGRTTLSTQNVSYEVGTDGSLYNMMSSMVGVQDLRTKVPCSGQIMK